MSISASILLTFALSAQLSEDASAAREKRGTLMPEGTISFSKNSSRLSKDMQTKLDGLLDQIRQASSTQNLLVVGHCDNKGSESRNRALSLKRARAVRRYLERKKVDREMLLETGVRSTEPIASNESPEEGAKNQRVELWLTEQKPVGSVTWVLNNSQSKPAGQADYSSPDVGASVLRNLELKTDEISGVELTFLKQTKVFVSSNSQVVAHDTQDRKGRPSRRTADVYVEDGTTVVRKLSSAASTMRIDTPNMMVDLSASHARVRYNAQRKISTVSIYDGSARVIARGRTVKLSAGEGVRVIGRGGPIKDEQLPRTPLWISKSPILVHGATETAISWRPPSKTSTTLIEFTLPSDPNFERPIQTLALSANSATLSQMPPGAYLLRLITQSVDGVLSFPSEMVKLISLAQPTVMNGVEVPIEKSILRMPGPAVLTQPAPENMVVTIGELESEEATNSIPLWKAGRYKVPYRLMFADGETVFGGGVFSVNVAQPQVQLLKLTPEVAAELSRTPVQMRIVGEGDQPITGLRFSLYMRTDKIKGLEKLKRTPSGEQRGLLQPCDCKIPEGASEMIEQGNGYYAFVYQRMAGQSYRRDALRIQETQSNLVQDFDVPIGAYVAETPEEKPTGMFTSIRLGTQLTHDFKPEFRTDVELGVRLHLAGILSMDLAAQTGVFSSELNFTENAAVSASLSDATLILPVLGRAGFALRFGKGGMYFGGGGGLGFAFGDYVDQAIQPTQTLWTGYLGMSYQAGGGELILQADYGPQNLQGATIENDLWPAITVGYRFAPWMSKSKAIAVGGYDLTDMGVGDVTGD